MSCVPRSAVSVDKVELVAVYSEFLSMRNSVARPLGF
jgi:hypothetical protein